MPAPYSIDLRKRVVAYCKRSQDTYQEIADMFDIGIATVKRYVYQDRDKGNLDPIIPPGRPRTLLDGSDDFIKECFKNKPEQTLNDVCTLLEQHGYGSISPNRLSEICTQLNIRRKKVSFTAHEQITETVKKKEANT